MECLSNEQLLALLDAARQHRTRDWLMILVAYWHGLRASEVVGIRKDHLLDGALDMRRLKGSLHTIQPLVEHENLLLDERQGLIDFARNLGPNQKLFPITRQTFWNLVQRHGETAQIPVRLRHPHILKHTIAMQTIHSAGIENVRQYLGHKSMSSTGQYLKVSDEAASAAVQGSLRALKSLN